MTPKTESRPVADEVKRKLTVLTGASEARILIDQVRREAASAAVAEVLARLDAGVNALEFRRMTGEGMDQGGTTGDLGWDWDEWEDVIAKPHVAALIASERKA